MYTYIIKHHGNVEEDGTFLPLLCKMVKFSDGLKRGESLIYCYDNVIIHLLHLRLDVVCFPATL